jgi:hypothetical protein
MQVAELSSDQRDQPDRDATRELLHPARLQRVLRERCAPLIQRAACPRQGRDDRHEQPEPGDVSRDLSADEHRGASEPTEEPDDDTDPERRAPQHDAIDQGDPDGNERDDQRDDAGVDPEMLRDGHRGVAAEEQQQADDGGRAPLPRGWPAPPPSDPAPTHQDRSGYGEPDRGTDERRDRLVRSVDRQVRGAPEEVHDPETGPDPCRAG